MSEESDMEKAIKVSGRCLLPPRFVPVAFLSAPAEKAERTWSEKVRGLPGSDLPPGSVECVSQPWGEGFVLWGGLSDLAA